MRSHIHKKLWKYNFQNIYEVEKEFVPCKRDTKYLYFCNIKNFDKLSKVKIILVIRLYKH